MTSDLARVLARQGRLVEAELAARDAVNGIFLSDVRREAVAGNVMRVFSEVLYQMGRYQEAEKVARAAISVHQKNCEAPHSVQAALARRSLANSLIAQERWDEALALFETIEKSMGTDRSTFQMRFAGDPSWALALLNTGRHDEARTMLEEAYRRRLEQLGPDHYSTAEILGFVGVARAATGDTEGAHSSFAQSMEVLLTRSRRLSEAETNQATQDRNLERIIESYISLLYERRNEPNADLAEGDPTAEAFRLAAVARARAVQRALSASAARSAVDDSDLADLVRREQDAQRRIAALFGAFITLQSTYGTNVDAEQVKNVRTEIDQLQGARAALMEEIERRFQDYAELINPKPPNIAEAQASLGPAEALIATYVGAERTYVWAVPHEGEVAFAAVDISAEVLGDTVAILRGALDPNAATLGEIPDYDVDLAYGLYEDLLKPVEAGWRGATSLLVVADGALGYLPLSMLPTERVSLGAEEGALFANYRAVPWLGRSHAVTVLPSVASLVTLRGLPPGAPGRRAFAGFGDPYFSPAQAEAAAQERATEVAALESRGVETRAVLLRASPRTRKLDSAEIARLPRLPDTADEIRGIAMALGADLARDVFLGAPANERVVKTMDLSDRKVIVFATHGLVPGDLNGLTQPALALSAPAVVGGDDDGLLTMGEILVLKLDADWVVLSACNTGAAQGAGAEAFSGLGRAFFYAGARALLLSNWPVETTSAKAMTTDLFRRQAEDSSLSRAEALRQTMLALIDGPGYVDPETGETVFSYAHPIFWAPFTLIGDGGGRKPAA